MSSILFCERCSYSTKNKYDFSRHLLSNKHLEKHTNEFNYVCECGKKYKNNNGLWKHKKKCVVVLKCGEDGENDTTIWKYMVETLVTKNTEWQNKYEDLQNTFIEEGKEFRNTIVNMQPQLQLQPHANITNNIITNNNTLNNTNHNTNNTNNNTNNTLNNTNNNTFNLQFFLNDTCKDAMDIDDFINSIEVTISDLKNLGKIGYVEGMSDLLIKKLKEIDITKRPLHCSDLKRETVYIRDKHLWNKENIEKKKLTKIATDISRLNTIALQGKYQEEYPNCLTDFKSKEHEEYGKIAYEAFGGKLDIDTANKKLFKSLMRFVAIDKNNFINYT